MDRRGQVTLFVIIAIVIVVGIGAFYLLRSDRGAAPDTVSVDMAPIKAFVDSCIDVSVVDNSYLIGENGGYIKIPEERISSEGYVYYYYNDDIYFPSEDDVRESLSNAVRDDVLECVDGFRQFSDKNIDSGNIEVAVEIFDDYITYNVYYPITVIVGEETSVFSSFDERRIDVRFGKIHSLVEGLVRNQLYANSELCLGCLMEITNQANISAYVLTADSELMFVFEDFVEDDFGIKVFGMSSDLYAEREQSFEPLADIRIFKYKFASI